MSLTTPRNCMLVLAAGILLLPGAMPVVAQKRRGVTAPREVARQMVNHGEDAAELRAEAVDLNDDGRPELIVRGDCAAVGNCSTWIFRRTKSGYEPLLNDEAQTVRTGRVGKQKYRDIIFKVHGSAYESNLLTYQFDGEQYHLKECLYRNYSYIDKEGHFHVRKRPQIKKC